MCMAIIHGGKPLYLLSVPMYEYTVEKRVWVQYTVQNALSNGRWHITKIHGGETSVAFWFKITRRTIHPRAGPGPPPIINQPPKQSTLCRSPLVPLTDLHSEIKTNTPRLLSVSSTVYLHQNGVGYFKSCSYKIRNCAEDFFLFSSFVWNGDTIIAVYINRKMCLFQWGEKYMARKIPGMFLCWCITQRWLWRSIPEMLLYRCKN